MSQPDVCSDANVHMFTLNDEGQAGKPDCYARSPVSCTEQSRLLIHVADRAEVSADDLKLGILSNVVFGHFEHSKMQVGDRTE